MKNSNTKSVGLCLCCLFLAVTGCGGEKKAPEKPVQKAAAAVAPDTEAEELPPPPPEGRLVHAFVDGQEEELHENQARDKGLTVIDLSNYWVPFLFSERDHPEDERKPNHYRPIFRKLANDWPYESPSLREARKLYEAERDRIRRNKIAALREEGISDEDIRERLGLPSKAPLNGQGGTDDADENPDESESLPPDDPDHSGAGESEHYLEVYGIPPSLSVLKRRAETELGRPCYADLDYRKIHAFKGFAAYKSVSVARSDSKRGRRAAKKMREEMTRLGIEDAALLSEQKDLKLNAAQLKMAIRFEALSEAQKQLQCEGLFAENAVDNYWAGGLDWKTQQALVAFERKNRIFGWGYFGGKTLEALGKTPEARLYDAFLRTLAERIADSTQIIEDGSARTIDGKPATYKDEKGKIRPVPNLIAEYLALTIKHMGLGTPQKVIDFLKKQSHEKLDSYFVAIPLPPRPPYYSDEMALHTLIDRGDVWYDYPYTKEFKKLGQPRKRMPKITLYVKWAGQDIALVTMNTTIGSWRTELASDGYEYFKYKNSDVGPRVWKDIVAGPVWMPPDSTPLGDLTKKVSYKHRLFEVPNYSEFGPHYASAYGLVAAFHYRQVARSDGSFRYLDNGIRSHGSVDYNSILRRYSHGCHRLYNHLAIRLFNFVLRHKAFNRVGEVPVGYARQITTDDGNVFNIRLDSRGYKYELLDPVPVTVLKGTIRGRQKTPIEGYMPKPGEVYDTDAQFLPNEWQFLLEQDTDTGSEAGGLSDTAGSAQATRSDTSAGTAAN